MKEPWDINWKMNSRKRVRKCAGMIGIVARQIRKASGQLWELRCAIAEGIHLLLIHGCSNELERLKLFPMPNKNKPVYDWTAKNIVTFLEYLEN